MRASVPIAVVLALTGLGCNPPFLSGRSPTPAGPGQGFTWAGRIVTTQTGAPVAGATVSAGGQHATTAADGRFTVDVATAATPATIAAAGYLTRTTFLTGGGLTTGRTIDLIAMTSPFELDFFDRFARGFAQPEFPDFILRWKQAPNFVIVTRYTEVAGDGRRSTAIDVPQSVIDRIVAIIPGMVSTASGARLQAGAITFRPDYRDSVEPGWVQVEVGERPAGLSGVCGRGGVSLAIAGGDVSNEVSRTGFARFFPEAECTCGNGDLPANEIIAHELGHAMGFFHTDPYDDALMFSRPRLDCTSMSMTGREAYHAHLAYARPVGNMTPDVDPVGFALDGGGLRTRTFAFSCGL